MTAMPRSPARITRLILFLACLAAPVIIAQERPHPDSTAPGPPVNSGVPQDSLRDLRGDSLSTDSLFVPFFPPAAGSLEPGRFAGTSLGTDSLEWFGARYTGDFLGWIPGIFPMEQSSEGQYSQISFRGADWRGTSVTLDGRPVTDPATSLYNLYQSSPAAYDQIEIVTGPRSFLYGLQGVGAAINLVSSDYSTFRPFTHLVYSEGPDGYGLFDGTYSQNISRRSNVSIGIRRQGTDGTFPNSMYEGWNVRAKFRSHLSRTVTLVLSDFYTSSRTDLNGGIDAARTQAGDLYDPKNAVLKNTDAYEKVERHDLALSLTGAFARDSITITRLTLYYSNSLREYRDEENRTLPNGILIRSDHRSSWSGASLTQTFLAGPLSFSAGGEIFGRQSEGSPNLGRQQHPGGNLWGRVEITPGRSARLSAFARMEHLLGSTFTGFGGDISLGISPLWTIFGGVSAAERPPNFFELFWTDSTVRRSTSPSAEHHLQAEIGMENSATDRFHLRAAAFARRISDAIQLSPYGESRFVFPGVEITQGGVETYYGLDASLNLRVWWISLEASGTLTLHAGEGDSPPRFPKGYARGGLFFRHLLFSDNLDLKVGIQGRLASSFRGDLFNPEAATFVRNLSGAAIGGAGSFDLLLIGRINDAYVHFVWENPVGLQYLTEAYYPGFAGGFRFGVSWTFLD